MDSEKDRILRIYDVFYRKVFEYLVYRLYQPEIAEDAVADVFMTLVRRFSQLEHKNPGQTLSWLYGTANNVAARYLKDARRQARIRSHLAGLAKPAAIDDMRHVDWPVLYRAIGQLKRKYQEIVTLRFLQELRIPRSPTLWGSRKAPCGSA